MKFAEKENGVAEAKLSGDCRATFDFFVVDRRPDDKPPGTLLLLVASSSDGQQLAVEMAAKIDISDAAKLIVKSYVTRIDGRHRSGYFHANTRDNGRDDGDGKSWSDL
jgi:hypothetical protein